MRNRIYHQWNEHFVVSKGKESCSNPPMIAIKRWFYPKTQSYGMLITVAAAKGQAQQAGLTDSINII